jgi:hypothetical protein
MADLEALRGRHRECSTLDGLLGGVRTGKSAARTVEWHLHEIFASFEIRSRRELDAAMDKRGP